MAQKKITELQLRDDVSADVNFPSDDGIQSYRVTAAQIKDFILAAGNGITAFLADLSVTTAKLAAGAVTDAKTSFTPPAVTTYSSGSGTYTVPTGAKYLRVRLQGGGGGGGGASWNNQQNGGNGVAGGATTFGGTMISAAGGLGGAGLSFITGGNGGGTTLNSPAIGVMFINGTVGQNGAITGAASVMVNGGDGGGTGMGGGGMGGQGDGQPGKSPAANSGGGGGGGASNQGASALARGGGGGGGGAFCEAFIPAPLSATYAYAVGGGGAGGTAGTNGGAGADGATGYLIIEAYFQ